MEKEKADGNMVALDKRGIRERTYSNYDNEDQLEHQEIVTPDWLVDELFGYVNPKAGSVLDPCVGPGAFLIGIEKTEIQGDVTAMDIQKNHIDALRK